mgnify:CR=1 FL=1
MGIRRIAPEDTAIMASIIRQVLTEFGANKPGFAWQDPELNDLYHAYSKYRDQYYVIEFAGNIVGGGGLAEFICDLPQCCEFQKMYLLPQARGKGIGLKLISTLLLAADEFEYSNVYLETLNTMAEARRLYLASGFNALNSPLGNSGHNACDAWYLKSLN